MKIELLLTVPKRRGLAHHAGPCGEAAGPVQRQKEQEKNVDERPCCGFQGRNR